MTFKPTILQFEQYFDAWKHVTCWGLDFCDKQKKTQLIILSVCSMLDGAQ
jgi:hypothetical protein